MVPKNLTTVQKANRRDVCLDLLDRFEREPEFFSRVITGDESWILEYDPETKRQSREWHTVNSPHRKKARMSKSKINRGSFVFLRVRGSSTRNLCHQTNCQSNFLSGSPWKTQEKDGMCATRYCTHLDAAPQQRPMSNGSLHKWIFCRKKQSCGSSAPLFTGSQSLWLLFIPLAQKPTWKGAILVLRIICRRA